MADTCPRCGFAGVPSDKCPQCGVVIATYQASLDKLRRGPQSPGVSPFARAATPDPSRLVPPTPPTAAAAAATTTGSRHASFRGSGATLFGVHVRSYLWSQSEFEGDRFAYHGTGRELIVGFAKAVAFFFLPATVLNTLPELLKA